MAVTGGAAVWSPAAGLHLERLDVGGKAVSRVAEDGQSPSGSGDARRDNSPSSSVISSSKSLLYICQQNYKKAKGEENPSPFLFTVYLASFSRPASTAVSLLRLIS